MNKNLLESLQKLLPAEQVEEISSVVEEILESHKKELEKEYNTNLEEAYATLTKELKEAEETGIEGYNQALTIINELRSKMSRMKAEYDAQQNEGYEEAYAEIIKEQEKNETLELKLHEEYEARYQEMRKFFVDKLHEFLTTKGKEVYETARKDIMADPMTVEHKLVLDKIVNTVSNYITDEDKVLATGTKLDEASKKINDLSSKIRILEARNIRLSSENTKLNEQVQEAADMLVESQQIVTSEGRKARAAKAKSIVGKGDIARGSKIITEAIDTEDDSTTKNENTIMSVMTKEQIEEIKYLSGQLK
jgi:outer membrane murein-binding lipoprotein Lpp